MKSIFKIKKWYLLSFLTALLCLCTFFGFAMETKEAKAETATVTWENGASIRIDDSQENSGIRFAAKLDETTYQKVVKEGSITANAELGMLIIPNALYEKAVGAGTADYISFVEDKTSLAKADFTVQFTADKIYARKGGYYVYGAMIDISNYAREFRAIVYYSLDNGTNYVYSEASTEARSVFYVADRALQDHAYGYTSAEQTLMAQIVSTALNTESDLDLTMKADDEPYFYGITDPNAFSGYDPAIISIEDGKIIPLKGGETTVTVSAYDGKVTHTIHVTVEDNTRVQMSEGITLYSNRADVIEEASASSTRHSSYVSGPDENGYYSVSSITDVESSITDNRSYVFVHFDKQVQVGEHMTISFVGEQTNADFGDIYWRIDANEKKNAANGYLSITSYVKNNAIFNGEKTTLNFVNTTEEVLDGFYLRIISNTANKLLNFKIKDVVLEKQPNYATNGTFDGAAGNISVVTAENVKEFGFTSSWTGKRAVHFEKTTNSEELYEGATSGLKITSSGDSVYSVVYFVFKMPVEADKTYAVKYDAKWLDGTAPTGATRKMYTLKATTDDQGAVTYTQKEYTNAGISANPGMVKDAYFKFKTTEAADLVVYEFIYSTATSAVNFTVNNLRLEVVA